ncbi:hypothetical protein [Streptomyces sp. RKAG337]|uniref:hypothetical protein n=1 Tax=Streptomyces sp. RKAG337 TaxID=2893404 RepID=UPI002033C4F7|nr:hypothetical protein [Streptomyces sp. RKAG337]MCM2425287.1 hypothetical protein [Streptomyces sp. RKAG337]
MRFAATETQHLDDLTHLLTTAGRRPAPVRLREDVAEAYRLLGLTPANDRETQTVPTGDRSTL